LAHEGIEAADLRTVFVLCLPTYVQLKVFVKLETVKHKQFI
jgi:hypothetical protein